jgi:GT2 family glycosyltransferase
MSLTAIVVTYRSAEVLGPCLASLAPLPTLVVDNCSRDEVRAVVGAHVHARLVPRPHNDGFAAAVNTGLAECHGDVLLVNPDARAHPGAIDALLEALVEEPDAGIVVPRLLYEDGTVQPSVRTFKSLATLVARRTPLGRFGPLRRLDEAHTGGAVASGVRVDVDWALGAVMLVRRAALDAVGGMDDRFFLYEEDQDWCIRMHREGWRVVLEPNAIFTHQYQRSSRRSLHLWDRPTRAHWHSVGRLVRKYPGMVLLGRRPTPVGHADEGGR